MWIKIMIVDVKEDVFYKMLNSLVVFNMDYSYIKYYKINNFIF